ncbi:MAG: hypothetical protein HYT97_04970 [Elusimicrobia bacterium]|nr:hypothetical protein [Elusimicrobiota bacterium]OGR79883.1 MAG: hypothetical protein A3B80_01100 [Elusimicrobia bacterium RIFCSPHIGHO2_02_FULL_39_36]
MKLKKSFESLKLFASVVSLFVLNAANLWADLGNVNENTLKESIGRVIGLISGIAAPVVLALGLLVGGIKYHNGDEEAISYIKGGIIGAILAGGAWGISKWLLTAF